MPVNTNYRYGDDELRYLWTNSDAAAVMFDAEFTEVCARLRPIAAVGAAVAARRRRGDDPEWATPYEAAATIAPGPVGRTVGPFRRRPVPAVHRRHDRHAEGRDVAAGRAVPDARVRTFGDWAAGPADANGLGGPAWSASTRRCCRHHR